MNTTKPSTEPPEPVYDIIDILYCDFYSLNNQTACNGSIVNEAPGQQAGILETIKIKTSSVSIELNSTNSGKFMGVNFVEPYKFGKLSWRSNSRFLFKPESYYFIQLKLFYNCYASNCKNIQDKISLSTKPLPGDNFTPMREYKFGGTSNNPIPTWNAYQFMYSVEKAQSLYVRILYTHFL